jgi:hypothetical protein
MWFEMGRNKEAEAAFRQALVVSVDLAKTAAPAAIERYDLSQAHAWLADALMRQGKLDEAWAEREAESGLLEAILAADASNGRARAALAVSRRSQARLALDMGRPALARELAVLAARDAQAIAAIDATNAQAAASAATANVDLGEALLANKDVAGAQAASAAAQRYASVLTARDRRVAKWQLTEAREALLRGDIAMERRAPEEALRMARIAQAVVAGLPQGGRDVSDARWLGNAARVQAGRALTALGRSAEAEAEFKAVLNEKPVGGADEFRMVSLKTQAAASIGQRSRP